MGFEEKQDTQKIYSGRQFERAEVHLKVRLQRKKEEFPDYDYYFFDEVQKLETWSNKLKILYDNFPNLKIVISGSSSFHLEKGAKSNLTGRHFVINVEPLNFSEYLELKKSKIDLNNFKLWLEKLE